MSEEKKAKSKSSKKINDIQSDIDFMKFRIDCLEEENNYPNYQGPFKIDEQKVLRWTAIVSFMAVSIKYILS